MIQKIESTVATHITKPKFDFPKTYKFKWKLKTHIFDTQSFT